MSPIKENIAKDTEKLSADFTQFQPTNVIENEIQLAPGIYSVTEMGSYSFLATVGFVMLGFAMVGCRKFTSDSY